MDQHNIHVPPMVFAVNNIYIRIINLLIAVYMASLGILAVVGGNIYLYILFTLIALLMSVLAIKQSQIIPVLLTLTLINAPIISIVIIENNRGSFTHPNIYWISIFGLIGWLVVQIPQYFVWVSNHGVFRPRQDPDTQDTMVLTPSSTNPFTV